MGRYLIWVLTVLGLATATSGAGAAPAPAPPEETLPLGGLWKGKLPMLGGDLDLTISIIALADGKYFAALDVPAQRVNRMATEVTVRGDSVLLFMPAAGSHYAARFEAATHALTGVWTQPGIRSVVRLDYSPMPELNGSGTRLTLPYREEKVLITNPVSRLELAGTLTIPAGPGPFSAVVLVNDLGAQDRDGTTDGFPLMGILANYLTRRGLVVLRYDDRGVGQSGGSTATATTAMLVSDLQAMMNFLRAQLEVSINRIGVVGHGEGANVALLAAGQALPPAFVVSLAGYGLPGEETLLQQQVAQQRAHKLAPALVQAAYERQRTMYEVIRQTTRTQSLAIVGNMLRQEQPALDLPAAQAAAAALITPWQRYFLSFDPVATLDQVHCPVLLLGGTADLLAPAELHLGALERELKSVNHAVTVRRLTGVNHLFQPAHSEWVLVNGDMRPVFSAVAEELIRSWIIGLESK